MTSDADRLPLAAPVHIVACATRMDTPRLQLLARRHRGEFVSLLETGVNEAAAVVRRESPRVVRVQKDAAEVADVFPEPGAPVTGGTVAVAGLLRAAHPVLTLHIGFEGEAVPVDVPLESGVGAGTIAGRAWAGMKITALSGDAASHREELRQTGEAFGIATDETSLIVLETLADYLRYAITPPAELRKDWEQRRHLAFVEREKDRGLHLEHVVASFERRKRWWELGAASNYKPIASPGSRAGSAVGASRLRDTDGPPVGASWPETIEPATDGSDEEVIVLSPFMVQASVERGYAAVSTVAGSRIRTAGGGSRRSRDAGPATGGGAADPELTLTPWQPAAGYLERLERAGFDDAYDVYLEERPRHLRDAGFYLDVAGYFFERREDAVALRVLSNLAELQLEDAALLRVLGHQLMQVSRPALARPVFERVLRIRGEDPQSRRDLALACAGVGEYQRAVELLWEVVSTPWHDRFPDIEMIALGELNAIAFGCGRDLDLSMVDPRLRQNLAVGLRAVVTWDADDCDVDLWIDDPSGERAFYGHPLTRQGGLLSRDFTGGYGPEEFLLRDPRPGKYTVRVDFYGDRRNRGLGPVTVQVRLITGFGTDDQRERSMTVRLVRTKETQRVGTFEIPDPDETVASGKTPPATRRTTHRGS